MDVSISQTTVNRVVNSLSAKSQKRIKEIGQTRLVSDAFDNLDTKMPPANILMVDQIKDGLIHIMTGMLLCLDHRVTLEHLQCADLLWDRSL